MSVSALQFMWELPITGFNLTATEVQPIRKLPRAFGTNRKASTVL